MNPLRRLRSLFRKNRLDAEMAEEMRHHAELQTELNRKAGMNPEEARYAALRQFGNVACIQQQAREVRGWVWLEQTLQDLRYALRRFAKSKGFTAVVVLTLALGIGATTAIYSVVDRVLLNPVPGPDPDRLLQIGEWIQFHNQPNPQHVGGVTPPVFKAIEAERNFFADFTWYDSIQLERKEDGFLNMVFGTLVPVNFFRFFGVSPVLGRTFAPDEVISFAQGVPEKGTAIILSHAWWESEFGGDPGVLGTTIVLGGRHFTVVGVMPAHFTFPQAARKFWMPGEPFLPGKDLNTTRMAATTILVRPKVETSTMQVQAMLDTVARRLMYDYVEKSSYGGLWRMTPGGLRLWNAPLRLAMQEDIYDRNFGNLQRTLLGFLVSIGFVLLIVCANTASLTLARMEQRQHELTVRVALGASRIRLMRQLLTENLLLALLGGLAGLLVATWGMKLLATFNTTPQLRPIEMEGNVLGVALALSLFTGLIFGLAPALEGGRSRINERLKQGGLTASGGPRAGRFRRALVVIEVALATVLLIGAGLTIQSVERLLHVKPGFDPDNLLTVSLNLTPKGGFRPDLVEPRNTQIAELCRRLSVLPGVKAVGLFKDNLWHEKILLEGADQPILLDGAHVSVAENDFFRAARIPLLAGRYFRSDDISRTAGTVIVNETMARLCWPGESAVAKKFSIPDREGHPTFEVVGVANDMRVYGFAEALRPVFYRPYPEANLAGWSERLLLRTQSDPTALAPAVRREIKAAYPDLWGPPLISTMRQELYDSTQASRTYRNYLVVFAAVGLVLAALGIYGVLAYSVTRRTKEIGIRMALGADRQKVLRMILGEGVRLIAAGVTVGLPVAFLLNQVVQRQFFNVRSNDPIMASRAAVFDVNFTDPIVLTGVVVMLATVTLLACWLPARRAAKVDPMIALRAE